jgi:hypothetical protein
MELSTLSQDLGWLYRPGKGRREHEFGGRIEVAQESGKS